MYNDTSPFYFASVRKLTAVIGSMFNNIHIQRTDTDGTVIKDITVPIAYAPKQYFLARLREAHTASDAPNIQTTLPRLSYEMTSMDYDAGRKVNTVNRHRGPNADANDELFNQYQSVPYTINYALNMYTRNIDDILQITEQILPFFSPVVSVTINEIPEIDLKRDVPVRFEGMSTDIDYEGVGNSRVIIWSMNFSCATNLYPPLQSSDVIKKAIVDIATNENDKTDVTITAEVNPLTANITDDWSIIETKEIFE